MPDDRNAPRAPALLRCTSVNKSYGGVRAVIDASLHVGPGEIVGLIGPNGAGKTTLVDAITGQQRADSGRITIGDTPMSGPPSRRAKRAGFARTFQHPQVSLELTVRENILVGAIGARMASPLRMVAAALAGSIRPGTPRLDAQVRGIAGDLHIDDLDRPVADLTLGEQRIVEVARALLRDPRVLLLDEPFAGGDPVGVDGMMHALRRIVAGGCGVLVVDHNVDIVASLVDRLVLMDQGRVVFDGDPQQALASEEMREVYFGEAAQG